MSILTFLGSLNAMSAGRRPARRVGPRMSLVPLEDRSLPSGYTVTDLGLLIEGGASQATDINASAQVVGWASAGVGNEHAFLWQNGVMTDLGTLGGGTSQALGINDVGQVVGFSNLASDWTAYRAFLLTPEDTDGDGSPDRWFRDANGDGANDLMRNLGTLGGTSPTSVARDVNNLGQVVGNATWVSSTGNQWRPFLWQAGVMSNLGTLGGSYGRAQAINDAGQITGLSTDTASSTRAFLRTNGLMTDLGLSYGATDVNNTGQLTDSYFGSARLWNPTQPNGPTGTFASLGQLPLIDPYYSFSETYAQGINSTGAVVGHHADYYLDGESSGLIGYRATLWENGVVNELPLEFAEAINDAGRIVGNSGTRAYLLTPAFPELPRLSIGDVTVTEGNSGTRAATFTVTLSAPSDQPVSVAYATADGTATAADYQAAAGTLTIPAGQTTGTFTVLVKGDRLGEPTETFAVNLSGATNATIGVGQGIGTIVDDEPRISIGDVTRAEGRKNQTTLFTFTVTLSAAYDQAVSVSYGTKDGTAKTGDADYQAKTGRLTFAPGETSKTVTIIVNGDNKREGDETFYLDLFLNTGNSLVTKSRGVGTILNDD